MIRFLFVLFCFLAFSQEEKRIVSEKAQEGIKKGVLAELIPFDQKVFSNEEVSRRLIGNDFLIVNGPGNYFNILTKSGYFLGNSNTKTFNFFMMKFLFLHPEQSIHDYFKCSVWEVRWKLFKNDILRT